jgi:hypothetical protein
MSSASDYQIVPLSPEELSFYEKLRGLGNISCSAGSPHNRCLEPLIYEASYAYTSSQRTGRRTMSRRQLCEGHAKQFAKAHDLELPPRNQPADPPTIQTGG